MGNEFSRTLYLANSQNMAEYNLKVLNLLTRKDILFIPELISRDIIPYLTTRVGMYEGIEDITRYAEEVIKLRDKQGLTRRSEKWDEAEPYGIIDSHNVKYFENVSVQCASLEVVLQNYDYQQKRVSQLIAEKESK